MAAGSCSRALVAVRAGQRAARGLDARRAERALSVLQAVPRRCWRARSAGARRRFPGLVTGVATVPAVDRRARAGGGITGLFAVEAVAVFVNLLWTRALARRLDVQLPRAEPIDPELRRRFLSFAGSTTIIVIIRFVVWRRSELFVLQHYSTDSQIALYSIAFAAVSGLSKLPETVETVAMPAVANLVGTGEEERIRRGSGARSAARARDVATRRGRRRRGSGVARAGLRLRVRGRRAGAAGDALPLLVQPMLRVSEASCTASGGPGSSSSPAWPRRSSTSGWRSR